MRNVMLSLSFLLCLSACAHKTEIVTDPSQFEQNNTEHAYGEKCENAKFQLDKTVEEGQISELRVLKRNIELHCVWRRD